MNDQNFTTSGTNFYPMFTVIPGIENETGMKLNEDQYEVYVNDHLVGHKSLKNQGESLSDIDDFLRYQGLNDFNCSLEGDHYNISTNQANEVTDALSVYFNNR